MGEGKRRCRGGPWDEGTGGVHKGHFDIPTGMVVRGVRSQSMCQPALFLTFARACPLQDPYRDGFSRKD